MSSSYDSCHTAMMRVCCAESVLQRQCIENQPSIKNQPSIENQQSLRQLCQAKKLKPEEEETSSTHQFSV
eukprot:1147631-Pelagomonas_calceolata.AAC.1